MSKMENLAPADVARWLAERAILLIDVREPEEYAVERIHGALLFPLSSFDPQSLPDPGERKIVVVHHPLLEIPGGPMTGRVRGGEHAAERLVLAGADLVLSGHVHTPFVQAMPYGDRRTFAVGAGTLSQRLRGEPPGFNVIEISGDDLVVSAMAWDGAQLRLAHAWEVKLRPLAQIGIYAGFAATEAANEVADAVYRDRGITLPTPAADTLSLDDLDRRGRALMSKLHGDRGTQGYAAPENPFTSRLYPTTIPYGYGEIWHRPGLELRQRAMVSLAGFTALQLQDQLEKFAQSATNIGLTVDEVCEAIIQTSPYSGYAPALNALRWLSEVR